VVCHLLGFVLLFVGFFFAFSPPFFTRVLEMESAQDEEVYRAIPKIVRGAMVYILSNLLSELMIIN
jgi:hypothetical protein